MSIKLNPMKKSFILVVAVLLLISPQHVRAQKKSTQFVHPGMLQTRADLELMKQKVNNGEEPWKSTFEWLSGTSNLDFSPKAFTHVVRGSYGGSAVGGSELSSSAGQAYNHALMWYLTGNKAHAQKAIEIINAWSGTVWDFEGNDAKLLAGWTGHNFCNAAEILKNTDSGWEKDDIEQFKSMLLSVYYPLIRDLFPEANGNWDAAMINTMLCIGIFCDDRAIFDRAVNSFRRGVGNGGITKYIYPSGQCQESTRDMSHTQLGIGEFAQAAQVAWNQGVDLFSTAGNRLALGFEYTSKFMLGEDVPVYGIISQQGRGRFSNIYEVVYQHYHYVKGFEMPFTARVIEKTRERQSAEVLTMHRGPAVNMKMISDGTVSASKYAPGAGAMASSSTEPPANSILIAPGEPVQAALDKAAGTGAWVVLEKGVHKVGAAVKIPSNITLAGRGIETILFLDPDVKTGTVGPALINADPDMHDVTIRDFVVEGAVVTRTGSDPNQERRVRSYQNAPSRAGIIFSGLTHGQMSNINFEHLTVRNCTHQGVAIRGAKQVRVTACDFSDNGSSVVPGKGLQHNLHITYSSDCTITDSRFDTSPFGSGINFIQSDGISVSNCEMARNSLHGIGLADCRNIKISGNLIEGNDGSGIIAEPFFSGSYSVAISENVSRNNGKSGIKINKATGGSLLNNRLADNGNGDTPEIINSVNITRK